MTRLLLVIRHAIIMWRVVSLPKNRRKGGWRQSHAYDLLTLADREMEELRAAIWAYQHQHGSADRVHAEAADVSIFMAMVSDVCR